MIDVWRGGRLTALAVLMLALAVSGCDTSDGDGGASGPLTQCLYSYAPVGATPDFGAPCTTNADCNFGVCLLPGAKGNITNAVSGFCTRGCHCDDNTSSQLSTADKASYSCAYPGGCFVGQSQGAWRHVVPRCTTLADCTAINPAYTKCESTDSSVVYADDGYYSCGQLDKVCQAE